MKLVSLSRLLVPCLAIAASTSLGCAYQKHEPAQTNGIENQLFFQSPSMTLDQTGVVGLARIVRVARFPATDVTCHSFGSRARVLHPGELTPLGGGPPPDTCDGQPADHVVFVDGACEGITCTVTASQEGNVVVLRVTPTTAGTGLVRVHVKSDDGAVHEDAHALAAKTVSSIRLDAGTEGVAGLVLPVVAGLHQAWPSAAAVDDAGEALVVEEDMLARSVEGAAVRADDALGLVAVQPGQAVLHWTLGTLASRAVPLEVVAVSEVHDLFVYDGGAVDEVGLPASAKTGPTDPANVTAASLPLGSRLTSVSLTAGDYLSSLLVTRVRLGDGRLALASIDSAVLAPSSVASVSPFGPKSEPWTVTLDSPVAPATGTLTLAIRGGPSLTLPVTATKANAKP